MGALKVVVSIVIVLILIFGLLVLSKWVTTSTGYTIWEGKETRIVSCLSNKAILYVSNTCQTCQEQLEIFKTDIRFLRIVNCDILPDRCTGVPNEFPVWEIEGNYLPGLKTLEDLDYLALC